MLASLPVADFELLRPCTKVDYREAKRKLSPHCQLDAVFLMGVDVLGWLLAQHVPSAVEGGMPVLTVLLSVFGLRRSPATFSFRIN
jgi:hypothetical protein